MDVLSGATTMRAQNNSDHISNTKIALLGTAGFVVDLGFGIGRHIGGLACYKSFAYLARLYDAWESMMDVILGTDLDDFRKNLDKSQYQGE